MKARPSEAEASPHIWLWSLLVWSIPAGIAGVHTHLWSATLGRPVDLITSVVSEAPPWYVLALLTPPLLIFARRHPLRRPFVMRTVVRQLLVMMLVTAIVSSVFTASYMLRRPERSFALYVELFPHVLTGFLPSLLLAFYLLNREAVVKLHADEARRAERQRAALAVQLADAQLGLIESQLHPHFLFNTLDSAVSLVREGDPERAARALVLLSELLRSLLTFRQKEEIELAEELAFVERYLELLRMRFEERLHVTWAVDPGLETALIPPLALQPLVENAFKHGLERRASSGELVIGARADHGRLELFVEDDGPGPSPDLDLSTTTGLGISGTRLRLAELYQGDAELELARRAGGGARASVRLPLEHRGAAPSSDHAALLGIA
jgi:two-component system, LytTR family, sensor kinase